jgi:ABC-type sugar transport system permease subunit
MARRLIGRLLGLALLVGGVLLALYGLFAILYRGDSGGSGDTYMTIAGHEMDAGLAGAIALLIAFFAILFSAMFLRRRARTMR